MALNPGKVQFITSAVSPAHYPPPGPPEVAFAGRSNVGKSSLINALVGRKKLVRVSSRPGRTQQINFFDAGSFVLVDLPGYGYAKVPTAVKASWQGMVDAYLTGRQVLAAVVVILDLRRDLRPDDVMLLDFLAHHDIPAVVVLTKADKLSKNQQASRLAALRRPLAGYDGQPVLFSAQTGLGREALWARLRALTDPSRPAGEGS